MKTSMLTLALLACAQSAFSQGFINTTFERPPFQQPPPPTGFPQLLDWSTWAPGWSHSSGSDTGVLYYDLPHLGISQWYLLVRNPGSTFYGQPLAGNYSLALHSGYANNQDPNSPWVDAFISQTATIPADSQSIHLLAQGPFAVFANGSPISMMSLGGNEYGGDISGFAGALTEVKIMSTTPTGNLNYPPVIVDNLQFSPTAVPEPATLGLFAVGLALGIALRRRGSRK